MKRTKFSLKAIIKYLSTVFTWSIFVLLITCAGFLAYYYISLQLYSTKGEKYKPKFSIYTIVSPSMVPNINVYDIIINLKVDNPSEIKVGNIITFISTSPSSNGMTITHRVTDIQIVNGEYQFTTKGDNNAVADSTPALYSNVIGKAVIKLPQLGRVQFFVASKTGWLFVVIVPAFYIILKDILKLIKLSRVKNKANIANEKLVKKYNSEHNL